MTAARWTRTLVGYRLLEAVRIAAATVRRDAIGFASRAQDVPQAIHTHEDRREWEIGRHERLKAEGRIDPKTGLTINPLPIWEGEQVKPDVTARAIDRAEEASRWPAIHVSDDRQRIALMAYLACQAARRHGYTRLLAKEFARRAWPIVAKSRAHQLKDAALQDIADALNAAQMPVTEAPREPLTRVDPDPEKPPRIRVEVAA
jgi:hypothetical protein